MKKVVSVLMSLAVCLCVQAETPDCFVDYVEATGQQWVDTGIVGRYNTKAEIKVEWMAPGAADETVLACRGDASTDSRINMANGSWEEKVGWGYGDYHNVSLDNDNKNWLLWEKVRVYTVVGEFVAMNRSEDVEAPDLVVNQKWYVDGVSRADVVGTNFVDTGVNLTVFANNINGSITGQSRARCYGLKIWQKPPEATVDDAYTLVRDFQPCVKNGRAGLYDAVSQTIFYSESGTDLVAGPDVNEPDAFVDYVESTGGQFVDLEVEGKSGVSMEADMMWVEVPSDGSFVAARNGDNTRFYLYHNYVNQTIGYNAYHQSGVSTAAGVRQTVRTVLKSGTQTLEVDGQSVMSRTDAATVNTGLNLYLFACNRDGAAVYGTKVRCYGLKLWDGDRLARDLRPCLKGNSACLYDEVSKRIFRAGNGGTLKTQRVKAGKPDYFVDYIESDGFGYIDLGIPARSGTRAAGKFRYTLDRSSETENRYMGGPVSHNERTYLGARHYRDKERDDRFYLVHGVGCTFWAGYNEHRQYPGTQMISNEVVTVTTNVEDEVTTVNTNVTWNVKEQRLWLGVTDHMFDVTFAKGCQQITIDDQRVLDEVWEDIADPECNLYLFACNDAGTKELYRANARCYGLKIWQTPRPEDGPSALALVRDLKPCVKDGEAALYDEVEDKIYFYSRKLALSYAGAPTDIDALKPRKILDYVESNGTQWYDLGVTGRVDTVAEFEMQWLKRVDDPDDGFLGSRTDGGDTRFYMWHVAHNNQSFGFRTFNYFNTGDVAAPNYRDDPGHIPAVIGQKYHARVSFAAGSQTVDVDGVRRLEINRAGFDTGYSMYLFAYNNFGSSACKCAARCHWLKLWQDGKLVRHFIPVELDFGVTALYDKVEQKVYRPQGGNVAFGSVIGDYVDERPSVIIFR